VAEAGVGDRLTLLGHRTDVPDLMRAVDGYLMSSAWEGLPMVLLEAASSELPIVATRVGGNEDAVTDGLNGLLVPAGDPARLADAMRDVMARDDEARRAMGRAGREIVRHGFDLDATIDVWLALYAELLGRKHTRRGPAGQPGHS
jgi:glycosyltransferase involved in cell wall biosynthesis